ncbi:MAG: hypothetical protein AB7O52_17105 [Planctomycetota bacterium]
MIQEHRHELAFLRDLIETRVRVCTGAEGSPFLADAFGWSYTLSPSGVPPEVEEMAANLYREGRMDEAQSVFRLLLDCFGAFANGYNYLGLIALDRGQLEPAEEHFRRTIEVGRKQFPSRLAKQHYWTLLEIRPFLRGLRNLTLTLARAGRDDEALDLCDRLDRRYGDDITAAAHRATIHLNRSNWAESFEAAKGLSELYPEQNLIAALAAHELGRQREATWRFLHAAVTHPRATSMVLRIRTERPTARSTHDEVSDHNCGVGFLNELERFLRTWRAPARASFTRLFHHPKVQRLGGGAARRGATLERPARTA